MLAAHLLKNSQQHCSLWVFCIFIQQVGIGLLALCVPGQLLLLRCCVSTLCACLWRIRVADGDSHSWPWLSVNI